MGIVVMVRVIARIAGMMVVVRSDLGGIFRESPRAAGAFVRALRQCLIHDAADCPGTASALRAAAEAAIDLARHTRCIGPNHGTNLMVGQDITGTDDHIRRFSLRASNTL